MSDISTNLSMNGFKLFTESEVLMCTAFNIKVFILFIVILIALSCMSSCMQAIFGEDPVTYKCGCRIEKCKCEGYCEPECGCNCNPLEQFGNDRFFSYKDTVYPNYTSYQSAGLTSLDESLNFGQVKRYVVASDDGSKPINIIFDIYCNLYLLNGAPFGQDSLVNPTIKQAYLVYLRKNDNRKLLGKLTTDSSQVYKLKFKTDKPEDYINFNQIDIVYSGPDGKESIIMNGRFTVA
jgi:hypothetical protein